MLRTTCLGATLCAVSAVALACDFAYAAPVAWSNTNGSNSSISWSNGQSDKGLFGNPTVDGNSFLFFPSNFEATASNGTAQTTSDRLSFKLTAAEGKEIQQINIREYGDWSIIGNGGVKAVGALYITRLNSPGFGTVWSETLNVVYDDLENATIIQSPSRPKVEGSGTWDGNFSIDLPDGVTSVQVVLNNILQATSGTGGSAFIQKKGVGDPADGDAQFLIEAVVPEPASISLLVLGGGALLLRRRRNADNNN